MRRLLLIATVTAAAGGGSAHAAGPFDPPTVLAPVGGPPSVAFTARGDAVAAWGPPLRMCDTGPLPEQGVWVAWRPAGGGPWRGPARLHDGTAASPAVAVNEHGGAVVVWHKGTDPDHSCTTPNPQELELRVLENGEWGPVETVPQPPLQPNRTGAVEAHRVMTGPPKVAIGPDGTVAVAWHRTDYGAETYRTVAVLRTPGGAFTTPQPLADNSEEPELAGDGHGRFTVAMLTDRRVAIAERGPGDGAFGPVRDVATGVGDDMASLAVNRRGDGLLSWGDGAVHRPAGGDWGPPERLETYGRTTSAVNERGDGLVTWSGPALHAQFRPAGGGFGPPAQTALRHGGSLSRNAAGLDALGTAVVLQRIDDDDEPRRRFAGYLRHRHHPFAAPVDATPPGTHVLEPRFATDAFGNGLVAYAGYAVGQRDSHVAVVDYSATPPRVSELRASGPAEFRFRLSEPARVTLSVWRGRRPLGAVRSRAVPGVNRIVAPRRLRRRLAPGRRYVARLLARDAGRRLSRPLRVRFRVR